MEFARLWLRAHLIQSIPFFMALLLLAESDYKALYDYDRVNQMDTHSFFITSQNLKVDLPISVRFFGQQFTSVYLSKDGLVGFDNVHYIHHSWRNGIPELSAGADKPFIAPFHHDGYVTQGSPQKYTGRMFWRLFERSRLQDDKFLKDIGAYLSLTSVNVTDFDPHFVLLVTWENVTRRDTSEKNTRCEVTTNPPCPSATFQLAIAANEIATFVVFNYAKIDIPFQNTHLAGINGGRGRGWRDVIKCSGACTKKRDEELITRLPVLQGSDVDGRYIFLVHDDIIIRGGCVPQSIPAASLEIVEVFPRQVSMLGGEVITVSARCQKAYTPIYCRYGGKIITDGQMTTTMRGRCYVPKLSSRGQVKIEVSSDRDNWHVYSTITVIAPQLLADHSLQDWFQMRPGELSLTWIPRQLSVVDTARVDVVLVGYRETEQDVQWKDLLVLAENHPNSAGRLSFNPVDKQCQQDCDQYLIGVVEVRLSRDFQDAANERMYVSVGPIILGWHNNKAMTDAYGERWPEKMCKSWADQEQNDVSWLDRLLPCPCTIQQTLADWGRWQPDIGCSIFHSDSNCVYNKGAKHCVRSVQSTPDGAGSHCCYNQQNVLTYAQDSYYGSTSERAHAWSSAPQGTAGRVPIFSHLLKDVVPRYFCCSWSSEGYCDLYAKRRPTRDCNTYVPPGIASVYGDPHIETFDGKNYYFGGAGDFWLLNSPGTKVQARFTERISPLLKSEAQYLQPTVMTSIVISSFNSDTVTITLTPPDDPVPRRLGVKVNNKQYFFDNGHSIWQDFRGLSIVNNVYCAQSDEDRYHSNFSVLLNNGDGIQVAERLNVLHVVITLPPFSNTADLSSIPKGLLGTWDGNSQNEFMMPELLYVPFSEALNEQRLYSDFAIKWEVSQQQSLFLFPLDAVKNRRPYTGQGQVINPSGTPAESDVRNLCGSVSTPCARDFYVTGNSSIALNTKKAQDSFHNLHFWHGKFWWCGLLDIPMAQKDNIDYRIGSTVRVTGCKQGIDSLGHVTGIYVSYTCVQEGANTQPKWTPDIDPSLCAAKVESTKKEVNLAMVIGIPLAIVAVIIIAVIVIVILQRRRSQNLKLKKREVREEMKKELDTGKRLLKDRRRERSDTEGPVLLPHVKRQRSREEIV